MTVVVAQVAVPAAAGPGLKRHWHGIAGATFIHGADLLEQGFKADVEGCGDANLLHDIQGEVFERLFGGNHDFSLASGWVWGVLTLSSARSLMRCNWCCQ